MADLTITAASVVAGSGALTRWRTAGATITQGQAVYLDTADSYKAKLADADVQATAEFDGIALGSAASGQPVLVLIEGSITIGATLTLGIPYVVSTTPGGIAPYSDLASGDYVTFIGLPTSTTVLYVQSLSPGVAKP